MNFSQLSDALNYISLQWVCIVFLKGIRYCCCWVRCQIRTVRMVFLTSRLHFCQCTLHADKRTDSKWDRKSFSVKIYLASLTKMSRITQKSPRVVLHIKIANMLESRWLVNVIQQQNHHIINHVYHYDIYPQVKHSEKKSKNRIKLGCLGYTSKFPLHYHLIF